MDIKKSLINADDCVLIIVDFQDHFLAKLPSQKAKKLVNRVIWLMEVAKLLSVPIIVTLEDEKSCGGLNTGFAKKLPSGAKVFNKMVYDLASQTEILDAVCKTGRSVMVLGGLETDVCIAQSVIGLLRNGFQVVILADATDSPGEGHVSGLERIRGAGGVVMRLKGLYYEWIRTVSTCNKMDEHLKRLGHANGIAL